MCGFRGFRAAMAKPGSSNGRPESRPTRTLENVRYVRSRRSQPEEINVIHDRQRHFVLEIGQVQHWLVRQVGPAQQVRAALEDAIGRRDESEKRQIACQCPHAHRRGGLD